MTSQPIQPQPGRRPVYPVDSGPPQQHPGRKPDLPPPGSPDDPASDENTEPANHPNDG
ncbi:MAG TPA: hypothetical protein VIN03_15100 [Roseateles sp.]